MEQDSLKATELDKITCSYNLQMLKAALGYFPPSQRRLLSVWIKAQELKNTMNLFSSPNPADILNICSIQESTPKKGFFDVLSEIMEYGSPEQKQAFNRFNTMLQLASLFEQSEQSKEAPPEESTPVSEELSAASLDTSDSFQTYIRSSLTEEQKTLFDSYRAMFHSFNNSTEKESLSHE